MLDFLTKCLKNLFPLELWDTLTTIIICLSIILLMKKLLEKFYTDFNNRRIIDRWSNTPKDVVIVHRFGSALECPNASPFVLKLETYLRMAKIPYEVDENDFMSVKGKCPWISLNGEQVADSQLCIEFLSKKFGKKIGNYTKEQRALSTIARITMDEHFYWGLILWRYIYTNGSECYKFFDFNPIMLKLVLWSFSSKLKQGMISQGIGRHTQEDVIKIMCEDLRALSALLGDKKFILGDEPCEDDAAIFGQLAQIVFCCSNSPYEALINDELPNLKQYCMRMKSTFWPDWDDWCLPGRKQLKSKKNK